MILKVLALVSITGLVVAWVGALWLMARSQD